MTHRTTAAHMLEAYDSFMAGEAISPEQWELQKAATCAGAFAAAAYETAPKGGADISALTRSFLLALIEPANEELDYLRANPATGPAARAAAAQLQELTTSN